MFTKPFKVKSNTQIKSSDRKKFRAQVLKAFPSLTEDDLLKLIPNKEEITVQKIYTHDEALVLVYCALNNPFFFELDGIFFPTVYALWQLPQLLHVFTTLDDVVPKMQNGADLMLPGVVLKEVPHPHVYGKFDKGERIAVVTESNSAAVAVGKAALSSFDMFMSARRGRGIVILHVYGDHLWKLGTKAPIPDISDNINLQELQLADVIPVEEVTEATPVETPEVAEIEDAPQKSETELMDDLIHYCFFKAWQTTAKKATLPMLTSHFYAMHVLPCCPKGKSIDPKKSSYKKFSKFLEKMEKEGVLKMAELSKGVSSIVKAEPSHYLVRSFNPDDYKFNTTPEEATDGPADEYSPPVIEEVHIVTANMLPIVSTCGYRKGDSLTMVQIRKCVAEYVKREGLQNKDDKSLVNMNPVLGEFLTKSETHTKTHFRWDEVCGRCASKMTPAFRVTYPNRAPVLIRGKLEPVDLSIASRSGNKKVTLVHNLEMYGIEHEDFARRCRLGVQASTTIGVAPDKKTPHVLVQGNQINFIAKLLLEDYKLPKRYIRGLENAPKKKIK